MGRMKLKYLIYIDLIDTFTWQYCKCKIKISTHQAINYAKKGLTNQNIVLTTKKVQNVRPFLHYRDEHLFIPSFQTRLSAIDTVRCKGVTIGRDQKKQQHCIKK